MASLNGQTIASSYEQLLHVDRDGGGNANTLVSVKDGDNGTTFGIKLATNKVEIIPGSNDTNAFEVSQADGTAVLTVDSTNALVGVGAAPASGTADPLQITTPASGGGQGLSILRTDNNASQLIGRITAGNSVDAELASITFNTDGANDSGNIIFNTEVTGGSLAEKMRITSEGEIGINSNNPDEELEIFSKSGGNDVGIKLRALGTSSTAESHVPAISFQSDQGDGVTARASIVADRDGGATKGALIFKTRISDNITEAMRIDNSGKVGIGTSSPTGKLQIQTTTSGSADETLTLDTSQSSVGSGSIIRFTGNNRSHVGADIKAVIQASSTEKTSLIFDINDGTGTAEAFRLDHTRNVGISKNGPLTKLHVVGATGNPATSGTTPTAIARFDSTFNSVLDIGQGADPYPMFIQAADRSNLAQFYKLSLNPNGGNVGVGTLNPGEAFEAVGGNGTAIQVNNSTGDRDATFRMKCATNSQEYRMGLNVDNTEQHSFSIKRQDVGQTRFHINADGNIGIGTTSPTGAKLQVQDIIAGDIGIQVTQTQAEPGIFIDQNGNNRGLKVESTGSNNGAAIFSSNCGSSTVDPLVKMEVENSAYDQPVLQLVNAGTSFSQEVVHSGSGTGLIIQTSANGARCADFVHSDSTVNSADEIMRCRFSGTGSPAGGRFIAFEDSQARMGDIGAADGDNVSYTVGASDKNLKKNFEDWDENVLEHFKKLEPKRFHYKRQEDSKRKNKGYIAQDVKDFFPEAYPLSQVEEGDEWKDYYFFNPSGMVVYLMKAVQELSAKVTELENKLGD